MSESKLIMTPQYDVRELLNHLSRTEKEHFDNYQAIISIRDLSRVSLSDPDNRAIFVERYKILDKLVSYFKRKQLLIFMMHARCREFGYFDTKINDLTFCVVDLLNEINGVAMNIKEIKEAILLEEKFDDILGLSSNYDGSNTKKSYENLKSIRKYTVEEHQSEFSDPIPATKNIPTSGCNDMTIGNEMNGNYECSSVLATLSFSAQTILELPSLGPIYEKTYASYLEDMWATKNIKPVTQTAVEKNNEKKSKETSSLVNVIKQIKSFAVNKLSFLCSCFIPKEKDKPKRNQLPVYA